MVMQIAFYVCAQHEYVNALIKQNRIKCRLEIDLSKRFAFLLLE